MSHELRQATAADYDYCYAVTKANMHALFCRHWGGWSDAGFRQGFAPAKVRMILVGGGPAGYISMETSDGVVFIDNLQVSSEHQGQGIGSAVLLAVAGQNPSKTIRLNTFVDNPARRLYERLGFVLLSQESEMLHMERQARPVG